MPIAGAGMLMTSMDIDAEHERDFNRWYDGEHLAERVAIPGFVEARRYVAIDAAPKYLGLYSTENFDVLDSDAYRTALANQTEWSKTNIGRFRNMLRSVARITVSRGQGRGAALGLLRIRPPQGGAEPLREAIRALLDPGTLDGILSMHLMESDPRLSKPLTDDPAAPNPAARDWYVLIDGTDPDAVARLMDGRFDAAIAAAGATLISIGTYRLLWDLAKSDL
ncbi:hypothetical protein FNL55_09140 [Tardiphaga sp. vice352]|uniref:DUF4286 family protein n=1 Tax=unclassified Tardiphaga TaxID=2631404 RepID=UPI00116406A6|nr:MULTISPECIES: DUF4286 family protein [unclassified Tardiphaga]QDM16166.1 hypothetical protein FNL53_09805 [Tardiphaga sp. vice278]QDM21193.1 hypothetical protein FIU28_08735 [Tardiphaga sp. vice154]QDM26375.1 hypothetical protein FNL56_09965 [Tardiphaga sp. vice304]QDM31443.1 hypothetical protein FNL55_09140 [Tardiphaga sp. vice352]